MKDDISRLIFDGFAVMGIDCPISVVDAFRLYLDELKKWNKAYNLTAIRDDREIVIKHFFDSLLYLLVMTQYQRLSAVTYCDVGSGAGFPGLPIAIIKPDFKATLIEPSHKKCGFLNHLISVLGLQNVLVMQKSVQEIKDMSFDVIMTRALFTAKEMINKCRHIAKPDAIMLLSKGQKADNEIKNIPQRIKHSTYSITLPLTDIKRTLIIIYAS